MGLIGQEDSVAGRVWAMDEEDMLEWKVEEGVRGGKASA